ncbi:DeoR/GlpR family DNA-binding transcription regulator [Cognatishimia sp. SS12]|uniref:DeoR/GlpR family DNA-binding transcription regulator n=1 Tax=Cognatishimia sp. SS12 TaxID=2979465 RepID=UPI00232C766E|nr:DeoR/GlpR family DNA-binding transcription regulator [Cognatishimia sp. SS12]MDC0739486.1 DeoR/GlpR family DNA-binding transcription regulator [Cognatishimia sp. SS12]
MALNDRQEKILHLLRAEDRVEVDDLSRRFAVTTQTVRRDLTELCERGLATRTHGGARKLVSTASFGYEERRLRQSAEKQAIAKRAAALIPDGASLLLNIGTTTEQVAAALATHEELTVITNNVNVIHIMRGARLKSLVIAGGSVRQSDGAVVGVEAVEFINRYKVDFAVIGTSSMDEDGAILDFDEREVAVARAILQNARTKILVTDVSKFDRSAPVRICDVADLDYVITDTRPPARFVQAAEAGGTKLINLSEPDD